MMPPVSPETLLSAVNTGVRDNVAYVPPYGSNGALYLRPLLFGSGPRIGLVVEEREVGVDELETFDEVLACGTAVVLTPIGSVTREGTDGAADKVYKYNEDGKIGDTTMRLYNRVRAI